MDTTDFAHPDAALRERLSALADGELDDAGSVAAACAQWREHGEARSTWHTYQLIGDVLRSDDLACDAARHGRFMASLRTRLAAEPVVLAPSAAAAVPLAAAAAPMPGRGGRTWMAPAAVAAGFVAVAGVLMVTGAVNLPTAPGAATSLAAADVPARVAPAVMDPVGPAPGPALEPQTFIASGELIRDVRLDRYLAAHKQFAGSSALGVPSAFLRNATAEASRR